jgi:hypothetical protein
MMSFPTNPSAAVIAQVARIVQRGGSSSEFVLKNGDVGMSNQANRLSTGARILSCCCRRRKILVAFLKIWTEGRKDFDSWT